MLGKNNTVKVPNFSFFIENMEEIKNENRVIKLEQSDFELINPNTKTCPMFKTNYDAQLVRKIYLNSEVLFINNKESNPFRFKYSGMFHMSSDSDKFKTLHAWKTLELIFFDLYNQADGNQDKYYDHMNRYRDKFNYGITNNVFGYDYDESGEIEEDEEDTSGTKVQFIR